MSLRCVRAVRRPETAQVFQRFYLALQAFHLTSNLDPRLRGGDGWESAFLTDALSVIPGSCILRCRKNAGIQAPIRAMARYRMCTTTGCFKHHPLARRPCERRDPVSLSCCLNFASATPYCPMTLSTPKSAFPFHLLLPRTTPETKRNNSPAPSSGTFESNAFPL